MAVIRELSVEEFQAFLQEVPRYLIFQTPAFARMREAQGRKLLFLGLVEERSGEILAAGVFYRLSYKKFFYSLECKFGPLYREGQAEALLQMAEELLKWTKSPFSRIACLRFVPFAQMQRYEDVSPTGERGEGQRIVEGLIQLGFQRLAKEFYEQEGIEVRYTYVRPIDQPNYSAFLKTCENNFRRNMQFFKKLGLKTRYLASEEMAVYHRIMSQTAERLNGVEGLRFPYPDDIQAYLGEDVRICVTYMDCAESLALLDREEREVEALLRQKRAGLSAGMAPAPVSASASIAPSAVDEQEWMDKLLPKKLGQIAELEQRLGQLQSRKEQVRQWMENYGPQVDMACACFFFTPSDVVYFQGGAIEEFMAFRPVYAIHETILQEAFARGTRFYNLFGVTGQLQEEASDAGVLAFKRKFKGRLEEYPGTFDYHPSWIRWLVR